MVDALIIVHVIISLVGIVGGFIVVAGMLTNRRFDRSTAVFLIFTVLTSLSGFIIPADRFLPSHAFGILSMIVLPIAIFARYRAQLRGAWRWIFIIAALLAQYLNVFVLIVQSFLKIPALHALAPNQNEPPFAIAQMATLALFIAFGVLAVKRFRSGLASSPAA